MKTAFPFFRYAVIKWAKSDRQLGREDQVELVDTSISGEQEAIANEEFAKKRAVIQKMLGSSVKDAIQKLIA